MNADKGKKKIAIIGSGFSGMSAAAYLAKDGHEVHVFEKHSQPGGRARQFRTSEGFVFDMGPSWYWMPDIIEGFFQDFAVRSSDFYQLVPLDPQFEIVFAGEKLIVPADMSALRQLFEETEAGAGKLFDRFMKSAKYKYEVGMQDFVRKPCYNWLEFIAPKIALSALKLDLLSNFRSYVARYFRNPKLRSLMEFPVIFLGASPKKVPALYSLMNYGGYALGTWYPMGGFHRLALAMQHVAEQQGAVFHFDRNVTHINVADDRVSSLVVDGQIIAFDGVIASADYQHAESLLPAAYRNYKDAYWEGLTFAPSCLIYYLGLQVKIPALKHHTLFFEHELDPHIDAIYGDKRWPEQPLFYACCPSQTDPMVAPEGAENLFLLMPLATGIADDEAIREKYLAAMLQRVERHTGIANLGDKIVYKRSYCVQDFIADYNAYAGNAYGLANTLSQTAVLKPKIKNKKLKNLFYTGQLTVPGPGVPPAIISGKIVANELSKLMLK